jgi:uncharacterized protein with HEPN domain
MKRTYTADEAYDEYINSLYATIIRTGWAEIMGEIQNQIEEAIKNRCVQITWNGYLPNKIIDYLVALGYKLHDEHERYPVICWDRYPFKP